MKSDWGALKDPGVAGTVIREVKNKLCCHKDTADYSQFIAAATDACRVHLPTIQAWRREKPWVDQDVCRARDKVHTARHQHHVLRTCQSRTQLAEARISLSNVYTKKQEIYYLSLANKVDAAAAEARHAAS